MFEVGLPSLMAHRSCSSRALIEHDKERVIWITLRPFGFRADLIYVGDELELAGDPDTANIFRVRESYPRANEGWSVILPPCGSIFFNGVFMIEGNSINLPHIRRPRALAGAKPEYRVDNLGLDFRRRHLSQMDDWVPWYAPEADHFP